MPGKTFILLLLFVFATTACFADIIYLKNGHTIQAENARIVGDKVEFRVFNGKASVSLASVLKIEKSATAVDNRSAFDPSYKNNTTENSVNYKPKTATSSVTEQQNTNQPTKKLDFQIYAEPGDTHATNYNTIAALKLLLEKAHAEGSREISRLQNMVYTKSTLGSSTTAEKRRIAQMQQELDTIKSQLSQFEAESQKAGLTQDEISTIAALRHQDYSMDELAQAAGMALQGTMLEMMKDTMKEMAEGIKDSMENSIDNIKLEPVPAENK